MYSLENLPRFATLVRHYSVPSSIEPADALLVVLAGDFVAPSMLSSLDRGKGMVDCLNAAGVTHVIFGNHEDDIPMAELHKRIAEFRGTWLSTNILEVDPALPRHQVILVTSPGGETMRVGLVGVVMTDEAVYHRPPFGGAKLWPANECVLREAEILRRRERCDLVIPITHQSLADDRALIRESASEPFALILGGHEHDVHVERDLGTWIVKAGSEAERAAIVEITWTDTSPRGAPDVAVRLEPVAQYEEDGDVRALVTLHMKQVVELERAVVLPLAPGETLSSIGSRSRQVSLGTLVCSHLRDSFGADTCILNGGGIRGGREYSQHLAFGDIKEELPFENEMVKVSLPGAVLREAILASRALAPQESGGFLQVDDGVTFDATTGDVTEVAGAPLELNGSYQVVTVRAFFTGMDHEDPLVLFASAHPEKIPPVTTGRELKEALLEALALDLWRKLGGFDALDTDGDGLVTALDIERSLTVLFGEKVSALTVTLVLNAVDKNHDKQVSREESALADGTRTSSLKKRR